MMKRERAVWTFGLWGAQILLALIYGSAGFLKLTRSMPELAAMGMSYAVDFPEALTRFVGAVEVLGAIGIVLPAALRILPVLTPFSALGFCLVQILAMGLHVLRGELEMLPVNLALLGLSIFVLWGRLIVNPVRRPSYRDPAS